MAVIQWDINALAVVGCFDSNLQATSTIKKFVFQCLNLLTIVRVASLATETERSVKPTRANCLSPYIMRAIGQMSTKHGCQREKDVTSHEGKSHI